jgi:hypothetical protein
MAKNKTDSIHEDVCIDLTKTLESIQDALSKRDAKELSELSNHTMHCSSIYREKRALFIAMISYSLGKIVDKGELERKYAEELEDFVDGMVKNFGALIDFIKKRDFEKVDNAINNMLKTISDFDASFGTYVDDILEFSKIQKGAKAYEHGLSLSNIAEMIGVSKWDLMKKVGETKIHEEMGAPKNVKERFEKMKKLLKK